VYFLIIENYKMQNRASMKNLKSPRAAEEQEKFQEQLELELADFNQDDQDFIKTVAAFSRNLEADSLSSEL